MDPARGRTSGAEAGDRGEGETLLSIQYLRGAAALCVTIYHALQWADGGFETGRAGVDVFFIISGVIMWRLTAGRAVSPSAFLARRVTRVAPLYWLTTLAVGAVALAWPGFLPEVLPQAGHLVLSLAFLPHFDPRGRPFPLLPPGWTLSYEAVFYLLFAAALVLPQRRRPWVVTLVLALIAVSGFLLGDPAYVLGANPMLLQFAAGVWLGLALEKRKLPTRAWGFALVLLGLLIFAGLQVSGFIDELWRPLLWGFPAALVVGGALAIEADGGVPAWRPLKQLGDASYALYLVHLPATAIIAHTLGWGNPWLFVATSAVLSIVVAALCHVWIERPMTVLTRRALLSRRSIAVM